jgi:transposase
MSHAQCIKNDPWLLSISKIYSKSQGTGEMHKLEVTEFSTLKATLKLEIRRNVEARFLHRLHCATLVGQGFSCYQVATWFGESPRTIERWIHIVDEFGVEGLKNERKIRRASKVPREHYSQIIKDLKKDPRSLGYDKKAWCGRILQTHLRHQFDVDLGVRQCQRILKQLLSDS